MKIPLTTVWESYFADFWLFCMVIFFLNSGAITTYHSTIPSPTALNRSSVFGFIGITCLQSGSFSRALFIQFTKAYFSSSKKINGKFNTGFFIAKIFPKEAEYNSPTIITTHLISHTKLKERRLTTIRIFLLFTCYLILSYSSVTQGLHQQAQLTKQVRTHFNSYTAKFAAHKFCPAFTLTWDHSALRELEHSTRHGGRNGLVLAQDLQKPKGRVGSRVVPE